MSSFGMKIYTKTGDKGETALFGSGRVSKDSKRIHAYGTVDELNSVLGIVRSLDAPRQIDNIVEEIQGDLFTLGADLATPLDVNSSVPRIQASDVQRVEKYIDEIDPTLPPLKQFILPGGTQAGAMLHFARTVCRRAERRVVKLAKKEDIGQYAVVYLNRLADLFFVLARYANHLARSEEKKWRPR
jgi:cob(I)alamin adenosyltransferase